MGGKHRALPDCTCDEYPVAHDPNWHGQNRCPQCRMKDGQHKLDCSYRGRG